MIIYITIEINYYKFYMFLKNIRMYVYNFVIVLISIISILSFLEIGLRIKNHVIIDYDLEMWKYSKKLKIAVD